MTVVRRAVHLLVAGPLVLGACGDDDDAPEEGGASSVRVGAAGAVTVVATEYELDLAGEIRPGPTDFRYTNAGEHPHLLVVLRVAEGTDLDDAADLLRSPPEDDEAALEAAIDAAFDLDSGFTGQPGVVFAGDTSRTVATGFTPGDYVVFCPLTTPDGETHAELGMLTTVTVAEGEAKADEPQVDGEVVITDEGFALPGELADGGVFRVVNQGEAEHEIHVARVDADLTIETIDEQLGAYFSASEGDVAPPEGVHMVSGFTESIPAGERAYVVLSDLEPGRYLVMSESDDEGRTRFAAGFEVG